MREEGGREGAGVMGGCVARRRGRGRRREGGRGKEGGGEGGRGKEGGERRERRTDLVSTDKKLGSLTKY